jgi:hypothetical protein
MKPAAVPKGYRFLARVLSEPCKFRRVAIILGYQDATFNALAQVSKVQVNGGQLTMQNQAKTLPLVDLIARSSSQMHTESTGWRSRADALFQQQFICDDS